MTGSQWRDMFEQPRGGAGRPPLEPVVEPPPDLAREDPPEDDPLAIDPIEYKPWIISRVRSRPPMMLHLRRYEPKSGLWMGWAMSYPHLVAVEYVGDRMLSLDFGKRQFVIEGENLNQIQRHIDTGTVNCITEYSNSIWPTINPKGAVFSIAIL